MTPGWPITASIGNGTMIWTLAFNPQLAGRAESVHEIALWQQWLGRRAPAPTIKLSDGGTLSKQFLLVPLLNSLEENAAAKAKANMKARLDRSSSGGCWILSTTPRAPIPETDFVWMVFRQCSFSQAEAAGQSGNSSQGSCFLSLF